MLTLLLGMMGLVIDTGLLLSSHRQTQNAADSAALAAATDLMLGRSSQDATVTATTFVTQHNGLSNTPAPVVNIPPASGPYAGLPAYAEVIASNSVNTFFIHVLPGVAPDRTVSARAVAGYESVSAGEGVAVLDPTSRPGLGVSGGGRLKVHGRVYDNSEGGGVDENGVPVNNGNTQYSGSTSNNALMMAADIRTVGGVNLPENFRNIDPDDPANVLHASELPIPDPLITLDTPTVASGVDPTFRGFPQATNTNLKLNDDDADTETSTPNFIEVDPETSEQTMILHPGIYESITITGGNVRFVPGIYVLRPAHNTQNVLKITGGNVVAEGLMFYATGDNYNPNTGWPDINDGNQPPPHGDGAHFGAITINAAMKFSPIDFDDYTYDSEHHPAPSFEGMLFYQRRRNTQGVDLQGDAEEGNLAGTIYAKWAHFKIAGQGTYDAQFVVGSMTVTGQGDVTINFAGSKLGKAPKVFLVE